MFHKIVDGIKVPLTEKEIEEFNQRTREHEADLIEREKVRYKDLRENERHRRKINEKTMLWALWERIMDSDPTSSELIQKIILEINDLYPAPK